MALSDIIAQRYGKAFYEFSRDAGAVPRNRADLAAAAARLGDAAARRFFENPKVDARAKAETAAELVGSLGAPVGNLVRLLVERGRVGILPLVLEAFDRIADAEGGRLRAEVISALELSPAQRKALDARLHRELGGEVDATFTTDPAIIGGLVIRIGDRVIDGSVRSRLRELESAIRG